jgi:hypothetical protein
VKKPGLHTGSYLGHYEVCQVAIATACPSMPPLRYEKPGLPTASQLGYYEVCQVAIATACSIMLQLRCAEAWFACRKLPRAHEVCQDALSQKPHAPVCCSSLCRNLACLPHAIRALRSVPGCTSNLHAPACYNSAMQKPGLPTTSQLGNHKECQVALATACTNMPQPRRQKAWPSCRKLIRVLRSVPG